MDFPYVVSAAARMTYQVQPAAFAALLDPAGKLRARGSSTHGNTWKACSKLTAWALHRYRNISRPRLGSPPGARPGRCTADVHSRL